MTDFTLGIALRIALVGKRFERVVQIVGLRRSGNHAVVTWIVNGLEGASVEVTYDEGTYVGVSASGRTVHFNNVKLHADPRRLIHVLRAMRHVRRCSFLIVSYEDVLLDHALVRHHLAARATTRVLVRRSVLNVVASRLKYRAEFDDRVVADYQMPLDDEFLSKAIDHARYAGTEFLPIRFDDLLSDQQYRTCAADRLGLVADLPIQLSAFPIGSSFTGRTRIPTAADLAARWLQVNWPAEVVEKLWHHRTDLSLSSEEIAALHDLRRGPSATG